MFEQIDRLILQLSLPEYMTDARINRGETLEDLKEMFEQYADFVERNPKWREVSLKLKFFMRKFKMSRIDHKHFGRYCLAERANLFANSKVKPGGKRNEQRDNQPKFR